MIPLALGCTKASFLRFYKRIFSINAKVDKFLTGFIVLVGVWTVGFFFATIFECGLDFWVLWGTKSSGKNITSHCVNTQGLSLAFTITDFVTDVIIIGIPVPLVSSVLPRNVTIYVDRNRFGACAYRQARRSRLSVYSF